MPINISLKCHLGISFPITIYCGHFHSYVHVSSFFTVQVFVWTFPLLSSFFTVQLRSKATAFCQSLSLIVFSHALFSARVAHDAHVHIYVLYILYLPCRQRFGPSNTTLYFGTLQKLYIPILIHGVTRISISQWERACTIALSMVYTQR